MVHSPDISFPRLCPLVCVRPSGKVQYSHFPSNPPEMYQQDMLKHASALPLGSVTTPHSSYMGLCPAEFGPSHTSRMLDSMGAML